MKWKSNYKTTLIWKNYIKMYWTLLVHIDLTEIVCMPLISLCSFEPRAWTHFNILAYRFMCVHTRLFSSLRSYSLCSTHTIYIYFFHFVSFLLLSIECATCAVTCWLKMACMQPYTNSCELNKIIHFISMCFIIDSNAKTASEYMQNWAKWWFYHSSKFRWNGSTFWNPG